MNSACPFREGQQYRVRRDYSFLNHSFRAGDSVIFKTHGYSAKEGLTRYWFKNVESDDENALHVIDADEHETDWREMFEEIG
jgi:hypothetical protein